MVSTWLCLCSSEQDSEFDMQSSNPLYLEALSMDVPRRIISHKPNVSFELWPNWKREGTDRPNRAPEILAQPYKWFP